MTNYPSSIDNFTTRFTLTPVLSGEKVKPAHVKDAHDAITALETVVGASPAGDYATVKAWLDAINLVNTTGWNVAGETWTYASATTFTITGDKTTKYYAGMKLKLNQTTDKFFYIVSAVFSSVTTITVWGGATSLANAAITSPYYSFTDSPSAWPSKTTFGWGAMWRGDAQAGHGGTDTRIPYYTNVRVSTLTSYATIVNQNTNGLRITILQKGIYSFNYYTNSPVTTPENIGITLNDAALTTSIDSVSGTTVLARSSNQPITGGTSTMFCTWTGLLNVGDIIRPHDQGNTPNTVAHCGFTATLIEPIF